MTFTLPTDEEIERELAAIRVSLLVATRHVRSPRHSTRYRTTRAIIIASAAAALLTAGAIVVAQVSQQQKDHYATCFEEVSLDSQQAVFILDDPSNPDFVIDPIEACGVVWRNDSWTVVSNGDPNDPNDGTAPIPPLVACTLPDGQAAVFPREGNTASGTDFCEALGLADWGSD